MIIYTIHDKIMIINRLWRTDMLESIGERIKYLRERNGMTQAELAKKLGITRSAVNAWEMSISAPSVRSIIEISRVFNVSSDTILTDRDICTADITALSDNDRELVLRLIDALSREK